MADPVAFRISFKGTANVERMLRVLGDTVANVIHRDVAGDVARFTASLIKANTPVSTRKSPRNRTGKRGALKRSVRFKTKTYNASGVVFIVSGPRLYLGANNSGFHSYWAEEGHDIVRGGVKLRSGQRPRAGRTHGRVVGRSPARRFIRHTFARYETTITSRAQWMIGRAITREAKRLGGG